MLFTRVPDYFDGEFIKGVVSEASFSESKREPVVVVDYRVGSETFHYKTNTWFLTNYQKGQKVTVIYHPQKPQIASIYAFIGYWIRWPELIASACFFIILFFAAASITGQNSNEPIPDEERRKKPKYDDNSF